MPCDAIPEAHLLSFCGGGEARLSELRLVNLAPVTDRPVLDHVKGKHTMPAGLDAPTAATVRATGLACPWCATPTGSSTALT